MKDLFKGCWTIPNALSVLRILLIPVFAYYFVKDQVLVAVLIMAFAAITDLLDGKIARKFNQVSALGKILDPIADKLSQMAIVIILIYKYSDSAIKYLLFFFIAKELLMLLGGAVMLSKGKRPVAAEIWGKVATTVFYVTMIFIIAFGDNGALVPYLHFQLNDVFTWILVGISAVFTLIALLSYLPGFIKEMKTPAAQQTK